MPASEAGIETWRQRVDKVLLEQGPQKAPGAPAGAASWRLAGDTTGKAWEKHGKMMV